jgi:site-specific DNA-methyltransferase (adenine-specific)
VLTCIANLSNDEVFTPPELANRMLDTLAEAWAADHGGANLWADKTVRFLDPCTKSGVFLREITSRLTQGWRTRSRPGSARQPHPDPAGVRHRHHPSHQPAGAAQRLLLEARQWQHSIAKGFASDAGNIWFERLEHTWVASAPIAGPARSGLTEARDLKPTPTRLSTRRHQDSDGRVVWRRYAV